MHGELMRFPVAAKANRRDSTYIIARYGKTSSSGAKWLTQKQMLRQDCYGVHPSVIVVMPSAQQKYKVFAARRS